MSGHKIPNKVRTTYSTNNIMPERPSKQSYSDRSHGHEAQHCKRKKSHAHVVQLPFQASHISKGDYKEYRPVFALYLDIQKGKILEDLDDTEAKGRWKSFLAKWNRGELLEGWYDPSIKLKADKYAPKSKSKHRSDNDGDCEEPEIEVGRRTNPLVRSLSKSQDGNESDESIGPTLPGQEPREKSRRLGPTIPKTQDLQVLRETRAIDTLAQRDELRLARKADKQEQKDALEELIPRSVPGTRERQIEKKRELNEKMKQFREKSPGATDIPDTELLGGGDDLESYKKTKKEMERKKTERELRKEENLRARIAERQERLREYRAKEEGTMAMLKALAKQRFR